jgi:hypothetical protein
MIERKTGLWFWRDEPPLSRWNDPNFAAMVAECGSARKGSGGPSAYPL